MVCSMTGYGYGSGTSEEIGLSIEIRAVNHRYLDLFFRLPKEMQRWEEKIRSVLKNRISRGRIEISVSIDNVPENVYSIRVNHSLLKAYHDALKGIKDHLSLNTDINMSHLLRFSDLLVVENRLSEDEQIGSLIETVLNEALTGLISQRSKEGDNLKTDLLERCSNIEKNIQDVNQRVPFVAEQYQKRLHQKLKDLEGGYFDESRILTECAVFAERSDINEELVRLNSHLQAFRESLNLSGAIGRKLDFILQEMFREINTVGSKSNDYEIAGLVVEIKTELEKMREQVQNIE